jgi:hypothetical protein
MSVGWAGNCITDTDFVAGHHAEAAEYAETTVAVQPAAAHFMHQLPWVLCRPLSRLPG